jgi:hypothetical protein
LEVGGPWPSITCNFANSMAISKSILQLGGTIWSEALSFSFLGECATNVPCLVYTYQSICNFRRLPDKTICGYSRC